MKVALLNPPWSFEGSIYFGCRAPHLPTELGCAKVLLQAAGHETLMLDGALDALDADAMAARVARFGADMIVVATAPTYLFWRCTQPELRVPRLLLDALRQTCGGAPLTVAVGPHGSATPGVALRKLGCDVVIRGECEEAIVELAGGCRPGLVPGTAILRDGVETATGGPRTTRFVDLPALRWPRAWIERHRHNHHRFDLGTAEATTLGAEVEASRGCPYRCSFCAKIDFRDAYRRRDASVVLDEIDGLVAQGVGYVYFIDEIFLPDRHLLDALTSRPVVFGMQTRIDLWKPEMLALLGRAGCVSIEAGVESLTREGRASLDKRCRMSTDELADRLALARRHVPFVQANLLSVHGDDQALVGDWRQRLQDAGVWANDPVPLFPYPSSPDYRTRWGPPDADAWERAHAHYLEEFGRFSDLQDERPASLACLERCCAR